MGFEDICDEFGEETSDALLEQEDQESEEEESDDEDGEYQMDSRR